MMLNTGVDAMECYIELTALYVLMLVHMMKVLDVSNIVPWK